MFRLKHILICALSFLLAACSAVEYKLDDSRGDIRLTPPTRAERSKYRVVKVKDAWKTIYIFGLIPVNPHDMDEMTIGGYVYRNNPRRFPIRGVRVTSGETALDIALEFFSWGCVTARTVTYEGYLLAPKSSKRDWDTKDEVIQGVRSYIL